MKPAMKDENWVKEGKLGTSFLLPYDLRQWKADLLNPKIILSDKENIKIS